MPKLSRSPKATYYFYVKYNMWDRDRPAFTAVPNQVNGNWKLMPTKDFSRVQEIREYVVKQGYKGIRIV